MSKTLFLFQLAGYTTCSWNATISAVEENALLYAVGLDVSCARSSRWSGHGYLVFLQRLRTSVWT